MIAISFFPLAHIAHPIEQTRSSIPSGYIVDKTQFLLFQMMIKLIITAFIAFRIYVFNLTEKSKRSELKCKKTIKK
jgi:Ni,Fe-hydrogenase I cytochrome b subunit